MRKNSVVLGVGTALLISTISGPACTILFDFEDSGASGFIESINGNGMSFQLAQFTEVQAGGGKIGSGLIIGEKRTGWRISSGQGDECLFEAAGALTITLWIKAGSSSGNIGFLERAPASRDGSAVGSLYFRYQSNELNLGIQGENGRTVARSPNVSLVPDQWNHIAVTFDKGEVVFYLNGEVVGAPRQIQLEQIPALLPDQQNVFLGLFPTDAGTVFDDVGIWLDRTLSEDEIRKLHAEGLKSVGPVEKR